MWVRQVDTVEFPSDNLTAKLSLSVDEDTPGFLCCAVESGGSGHTVWLSRRTVAGLRTALDEWEAGQGSQLSLIHI